MTYKPVPWDDEFRKEVLSDPESRAIYEATKLQIDLVKKLRNARIKKKMTQDDVATIMHTKTPAISRLEAINDDVRNFPSLLTLIKFASAIGYELKFNIVPFKKGKKLNRDRKHLR